MKAFTIWQPWASLIVAGAKPYEFRKWRAPRSLIGQRIVIHAGRTLDIDEAEDLIDLFDGRQLLSGRTAAETCLHIDKARPILEAAIRRELALGAGIGTAIVGEPRNGLDIAAEFGVPRANDSDRDQHANWGWPMLEVETWPEPVPMKGAQGLWNWPTPADALL